MRQLAPGLGSTRIQASVSCQIVSKALRKRVDRRTPPPPLNDLLDLLFLSPPPLRFRHHQIEHDDDGRKGE